MSPRIPISNRTRQRGVVLFVSLMLLLILTIIGITAARMQTVEERMALNETNHQLALQSAEAALRSTQTWLLANSPNYAANANGLYELVPANGSVVDTIDWTSAAAFSYTGAVLADVPTPPQPAKIVIENLPPVATPTSGPLTSQTYGAGTDDVAILRVTAHANGGDSSASATLQEIIQE